MQLKRFTGDFRVYEVADLELIDASSGGGGDYFIHELRKEKLDTLEAIAIVAREAQVDRADVAFAGLKDRQGITEQHISIRGKRLDYEDEGLQVRCIGRAAQPITSKMSRGNRFEIVVRDLDKREVAKLERRLGEIAETGFPNYFDDQRFNCLRHGQGWVMRAVLAGRFDEALRQLIASPSRVAQTGDVKLKRLLRDHWGDWEACLRIARGPVLQRVFNHLQRQPQDFRGALAAMPSRAKLIHAYAYQSHLWNRSVSRHIERLLAPSKRAMIETEAGRNVSWWELPDSLRDRLQLESTPLYGPDGVGGSESFQKAVERTLDEARLAPDSFRMHEVPGMVLREEPRASLVVPTGITPPRVARDETNRGRLCAKIGFQLPRGSYATMLLKCVWARRWAPQGRFDRRPDARGGREDRGGRSGGYAGRSGGSGDRYSGGGTRTGGRGGYAPGGSSGAPRRGADDRRGGGDRPRPTTRRSTES